MKTRLLFFNKPYPTGFSMSIVELLSSFVEDVLVAFLLQVDSLLMLDDTKILDVNLRNSDIHMIKPDYLIGTGRGVSRGVISIYISEKLFETLTTEDKRLYILKNCYEYLLNFARHFDVESANIHEAYNKIKNSDFYFRSTDKKTSRNKILTAWIERRNDFDFYSYRLVVADNTTNSVSYSFIATKNHVFYDKTKDLNDMEYFKYSLTIPRYFTLKNWKKDKFYFSWGEEEQYEYDARTNELKRI
jgi:hypothetical protein